MTDNKVLVREIHQLAREQDYLEWCFRAEIHGYTHLPEIVRIRKRKEEAIVRWLVVFLEWAMLNQEKRLDNSAGL